MSRLRLFWCKIILGNHFIPHCMFGCAWKIEFFRKQFHLTVNICFTFLFSLQTIFRLRLTKRERERERSRPNPRHVGKIASLRSSGRDCGVLLWVRSSPPLKTDLSFPIYLSFPQSLNLSLFDLWFFCCCCGGVGGGVLVVIVLCGGGFCVDSGGFSVGASVWVVVIS